MPAPTALLASLAELAAGTCLSLAAATLLARVGRVATLAGCLAAAVLLLPLAQLVTGRASRTIGAASLAVILLPLLAWPLARMGQEQWATARRLGASPALILRHLVAPVLLPFLAAALLAGGALLALRRPPPPTPLMLPYPASEAG